MKVKGAQFLCSLQKWETSFLSCSKFSTRSRRLADKLPCLLQLLVGGKTKVKLKIATTPAHSTESSSSSSSTGRRHSRRGPRTRAHRNQRAAAHQAALEDLTPRSPLQLLPSSPAASGRRKVITVHNVHFGYYDSPVVKS